MEIIDSPFDSILVICPTVFEDNRGYFYETFNSKKLANLGLNIELVQDNQSLSNKGVLRGLHFQNPPCQQGKLVRVIKGRVLDVTVDIRKSSKSYGHNYAIELNEDNKLMLWIPPGFAHGFKTLENDTIFHYKCSDFYNKESEGSLLWNDPDLNIDWGNIEPIISDKDKVACPFKDFVSHF